MSKKTKQILSLLISVVMVFSMFAGINLSVSAETDILNYLTWVTSNSEVTITGCDKSISGDIVIPDVIEGKPVTAIGDYAFSECIFLEKIDIPDTVAYIGEASFTACCNLKEIDIPDSVREIGKNAFASCFNIKNVSIPTGVTDIKDSVFGACWLLENVDIPNSVTSIGAYAFSACFCLEDLVIPESVTYIEKDAFYGAYGLKDIYINNPETELCENSIYGNMWNLRGITLKEFAVLQTELMIATHTGTLSADEIRIKTEELEQYIGEPEEVPSDLVIHGYNASTAQAYAEANGIAFESFVDENYILDYLTYEIIDGEVTITDCDTSISGDVVIPDTIEGYPVTVIGAAAFYNCRNMESVTIGNNVSTIENDAFSDCYNLVNVTLPDSLVVIGDWAFAFCMFENIDLPEGLKFIGMAAFGYCYNLESITIPDGVDRIEQSTFVCCYSLSEINFPDSIKYIDLPFDFCVSLESIAIPEKASVDPGTLSTFGRLKDVYIHNPDMDMNGSFIGYSMSEISSSYEDFMSLVEELIIAYQNDDMEKCEQLNNEIYYNHLVSFFFDEAKKIEDFTIHGYEGSTAEAYAKEHGFEFVPLGDEEPEVPEIPDVPDVPDVPEEPEIPDIPDVPETPENPEDNEPELDFFSSIKAFFEKIAEFFAKIFETLKNLFA